MTESDWDWKTQSFWSVVVLGLLCVLAFWPMFGNTWVWDDVAFILRNPATRGLWPPGRFSAPYLVSGFPTNLFLTRPVTVFTYALDYGLWKIHAFGYHLTNLLLHFLCTVVVAFLVWRFSRRPLAGFLAGALFALHPGHATAVISLVGRSDLLSTLFMLLAFWGYAEQLGARGRPRAFWYAGSWLCYLVACFSKDTGPVFLGLLVLYEGFVTGKGAGAWWRKGLRIAPYLLIAPVPWLLTSHWVKVLAHMAGMQSVGGSLQKNFLTGFEVYTRYLGLMVFPLKLSPMHIFPVPQGFWDPGVLFGLVLLLGSLALTAWCLWKHPWAGFLASWFLLGLIPAAHTLGLPFVANSERWLYLPSAGLCALGGWGAWYLIRHLKGWARAGWAGAIGVVLLLFGIRTLLWTPVWRDPASMGTAFLASDLGYVPGLFDSWAERWRLGDPGRIIEKYRRAIRLDPTNVKEHHDDFGMVLLFEGRFEQAGQEFREAIRLKPDYLEPYSHLGDVLLAEGRYTEAEQVLRQALRLDPKPDFYEADDWRRAEAHANLGKALERQERLEEAEQQYREAIRLTPLSAEAHNDLGMVLAKEGKDGEAEQAYRQALLLYSDYTTALRNLAAALDRLGRGQEARNLRLKAASLEGRPGWMVWLIKLPPKGV